MLVRSGTNGEDLVKLDKGLKLYSGDKLMVRIVLNSDRNLAYVHLKDQRAAGIEPTSTLFT